MNEEEQECGGCRKAVPRAQMHWTRDRYGNPWKKRCPACFGAAQEEIGAFVHDEGFAGERLEEDE